jgi:hypothetical protein
VTVVGVNVSVSLTSGLGTDIVAPGAEPSSPAVWKAPRIAAAMALFRR